MKKSLLLSMAALMVFSAVSCSTFKKYKNKISVSDVKKVSDLIDFSFGDGENGPFDVTPMTSSGSKLIIKNNTDRTITVKAKGPSSKRFVVRSGKSSSANVKSGAYHFVAAAKGTKGCKGDVKLKGFNQYTWVFVIR